MTDQPNTQEPKKAVSQWVGNRYVTTAAASELAPEPTTQEAEKAFEAVEQSLLAAQRNLGRLGNHPYVALSGDEDVWRVTEPGLDALRSLRTQLERLKRMNDEQAKTFDAMAERQAHLQLQHTKDQERIEELEQQQTVLVRELKFHGWGTPGWRDEVPLLERIAELERVLANLGVTVNAGGSGGPAGSEAE